MPCREDQLISGTSKLRFHVEHAFSPQRKLFDEDKADLFGELRPLGRTRGVSLVRRDDCATFVGRFAAVMP